MKSKHLYIVIIILFIIGIGTGVLVKEIDANKTNRENGKLIQIDSPGLIKLLESKKRHYVYIGRPTCPYCAKFKPVLEKVIEEKNISTYYYNTDEAREKDHDDGQQLEQVLKYFDINSVPILIAFENGKIIDTYYAQGDIQLTLNKWFIENSDES